MRMSQYFLPTLKENPAEAQIVSHRLMLRAGLVRQTSAGIYAWLPLGFRVLKNIERIVREEQDATGAQEVLMPTIQSADLWRESGRYDAYGPEMLRIKDRHDREMLFGPTNEEMITVLFRDGVKSYRDLPRNLYHIQWKFRDEVRPRFGVMRGREFLMKDNYSFDIDRAGATHSYNKMFVAYLRTFARMGLKAIPMRADTGPIGGDLSHEFIVLADTGESAVFCHKGLVDKDILSRKIDYDADLQPIVNEWTSLYAATDEMHDKAAFEKIPEERAPCRARDRSRPYFLLRHQVFRADEGGCSRPRRRADHGRDGLLRHRRVAPGRRHHRSDPRRCRHRLAGIGGAVQGGDRQPEARRRRRVGRLPEAL